VAESKIDSLVRCGASVRVVAPEATAAIREAAAFGKIIWQQRHFQPSDMAGIFLVVAATSSPELHREIFCQAQSAGILCNAVDEPERCDFYYPAIVRRGPLQIAVSTSGHAPLLAQQIRQELEERFGPDYGPWTEEIGRTRSELLASGAPPEERLARLQEMCSARSFDEFHQRAQSALGDRDKASGKVYFLGAGPGDPELLTRKAWKILRTAEVVLHDALVPPEIVRLAPDGAEVCDVGKRCGKKSISQQEIHSQLIAHARAGRTVVRLQGGDPLVFGRAGEEIAALRAARIEFEIVPGVTAASVAAAAAQVSLTNRRSASKLVFLSAHRCAGKFVADWKSVVTRDATYAIYMPGGSYERIARELQEAGLDGATPCVIVSHASMPQQLILRLDLASLAAVPEPPAPAVLLVGEVTRAEAVEAVLSWRASGQALENEVVR
jgi:uroporphyrin-III C-methyltransferase/precorrin-2 dehydrogenase/sirohydrochlorin ferrochelatase